MNAPAAPSRTSPARAVEVRSYDATIQALQQLALGYNLSGSSVRWDANLLGFRTECGDIVRAHQCPEPTVEQPAPRAARFIVECVDGSTYEFLGYL